MGRPRLSDDIQKLIEAGNLDQAVSDLKRRLIAIEASLEACYISQELAEVYGFRADDPDWTARAIHYASLAGEGFVKEGLLPEALKVFYWLRSRQLDQAAAHQLRGLIASTFASRKSKKPVFDDEMPPPTPYQELKGSIVFDNDPPELKRFQLENIESKQFAFFSSLKVQELEALLEVLQIMIVQKDQYLYRTRDEADCFYLILQGNFEKHQAELTIKIGSEEFVGDLSFFSGRNRSCDVVASETSSVLRFDQDAFDNYSKQFPSVRERFFQFYEKRLFLNSFMAHPVFKPLGAEALFGLFDEGVLVTLPRGRVLWKEGSTVDRFYLLVQGVCQVESDEGAQTLLPGAIVGFSEFKSTKPSSLSIKAASECSVIEWRRDIFQDFMQGVPELKKSWQTISPDDYENFSENLFD